MSPNFFMYMCVTGHIPKAIITLEAHKKNNNFIQNYISLFSLLLIIYDYYRLEELLSILNLLKSDVQLYEFT